MSAFPHPFKTLSLRHLAKIVTCVLILGAAAISYKLYEIRVGARESVLAWQAVTDIGSTKEKLFRKLIEQLGVSGMIAHFKDYVITGETSFVPSIHADVGAARSTIATYRESRLRPEEAEGLDKIAATIDRYNANVAVITRMRAEGAAPREIDKAVRVDDGLAIDGFSALARGLLADLGIDHVGPSEELMPKYRILGNLRMSLGYGGLVHSFDNYILRHDEAMFQRFARSLAYGRQQVAAFRRHDLPADERAAVDAIEGVLDAFEAGMTDGRLERLFRAGEPPEAIYAAVSVNPAPLLNGIHVIERNLRHDEEAARSNLTATLVKDARIADELLVTVMVSSTLLIAIGVWFVGRRIIARLHTTTRTMFELASGNLEARIQGIDDADEIGEMSRALLVFRDSMRENITLNKELADSARMASLGALVAGIAHEINTPIGNALTVSTTLSEHVASLRSEAATGQIRRSLIEEHVANTDTAVKLLEGNLSRACELIGSFKQLAVDQTSDHRRSFRLAEVLKSVCDSVRPILKKASHKVTLTADASIEMESFPGALSQVVMNLVDNSRIHGFAGRKGGTIAMTARKVAVHQAEIVVEDDGRGIPPEILPRIFDAFFTTRAGSGGSGLGLHIVKTIVSDTLGGQIEARARAGAGVRFVISLPLIAPRATIEEPRRERKVYYAAA